MKKIIYISGKITGTDGYIERFAVAENKLKGQGYDVINPAKICSMLPVLEWIDYIKICLEMLKVADVIYMLKGWVLSEGAWVEYNKAMEWGIEIIDNETN